MQRRKGRPRGRTDAQRARALLVLMERDGLPIDEAARRARIKPDTVLRLLRADEFFAVYAAVRAGKLGPTAVTVEQASGLAAA